MGFIRKTLGVATLLGAGVAGAMYCKKRQEEREFDEDFFEDDDTPIVGFNKYDDTDSSKVTITINKRKVKKAADTAADKVIDATETVTNKVADKVGQEKVDQFMDMAKDVADVVSEKAIQATEFAKEQVNKVKDVINEDDLMNDFDYDEDMFDDVETEDDVTVEAEEKPSDITPVTESPLKVDIDILEDELKDF